MADKQLLERLKNREKDLERFFLRLERLLGQTLEPILGGLRAGETSAQEAASALGSLQTALIDGGLEEQVRELELIYADELAEVSRRLAQAGVTQQIFTEIDADVIEQIVEFDLSQVAQVAVRHVGDIRSQIMRSILTGETPDIDALIADASSRVQSDIKTEINTLLGGFQQAITNAKASEFDLELFEYAGPEDSVTRDFCQGLLDRDPPIYTAEEIEQLENGQGLPVSVYGGGYNCRHQWLPISEEEARSRGWEP